MTKAIICLGVGMWSMYCLVCPPSFVLFVFALDYISWNFSGVALADCYIALKIQDWFVCFCTLIGSNTCGCPAVEDWHLPLAIINKLKNSSLYLMLPRATFYKQNWLAKANSLFWNYLDFETNHWFLPINLLTPVSKHLALGNIKNKLQHQRNSMYVMH